MLNRRNLFSCMAAGAGAAISTTLGSKQIEAAAASRRGAVRRVIFFLQNQGFHPDTCVTKGLKESVDLDGVELPEPIKDLEPVKDKIHIVTGLHGRHTSPSHSAYFGALGGYRG